MGSSARAPRPSPADRRLVEHLQLEIDPAEGDGQGEIVGRALQRPAVEGDHPGRPPLVAVHALQAGQDGQARPGLQRPPPGAQSPGIACEPAARRRATAAGMKSRTPGGRP
jgi:hypothetical protein